MESVPMAAQTPESGIGNRRRTVFVSLTVAFAAFLYLFSPFSSLFLGWFVDFDDNISHRVHEITFGMLLAMVLVGVIVQLRSPEYHIAGMQQAVVVVVILTVVVTASTGWEWTTLIYLVPVIAIAMLHPSRQEVFRPRISPAGGLLFLMVMLTLPALIAFSEEFDKAANNVRFHQSHWGGMAAFGLSLLATGYLAALRVRGWPLAAWTTGVSMLVYGMASMLFRFDASARPFLGGILVLLWAVVWLVTAERARVREARSPVEQDPSPDAAVAPELRRARRGRLIGGVASGVARYLGVTVLFTRILFFLSSFFLVGLLFYIVLWVRIPLEASGDITAAPPGVVSPALATRRSRVAVMAPAVALALLLGVCSTSLADGVAPPVPHTIESASQNSCLECHGTGDEKAPVIDALTHNHHEDSPRHFAPYCGECHDLPVVEPAFEAAARSASSFGDYALSDAFRQDHPDMFVLDEDDMAFLVRVTVPQGVRR